MVIATAPVVVPGSVLERGHCLLGLIVFLLITHLIGRAYGAKKIPWRVVSWGVVLAFAFGAIVLYSPGLLFAVQDAIQKLLDFTLDGSKMIFGSLADSKGSPVLNGPVDSDASHLVGHFAATGAVVAFTVLPTIIFVSMLTAILYRLHVLGWIVSGLAWVMRRTMGTSGAETLSTAANIFVGQTEAPLIVKPFLATATRSELMAIMVGGFANIASGVLVVYTQFLQDFVQNAGGHLAAACFVSAPATLIVSKLIIPETETPVTADAPNHGVGRAFEVVTPDGTPVAEGVIDERVIEHEVEQIDANLIDAATRGTSEGLALAINVGAMLLAFTALVSLINALLGGTIDFVHSLNAQNRWLLLHGHAIVITHVDGVSLQGILGYVCAPIAWLCGVSWHDCNKVGALLGIKTVLNEFVAYKQMSDSYHADINFLTPRDGLLATYALCGFANIASVGIQIGGISVMAPNRRHDLSRLGFIAMLGGAIATCIGACVIGVLV